MTGPGGNAPSDCAAMSCGRKSSAFRPGVFASGGGLHAGGARGHYGASNGVSSASGDAGPLRADRRVNIKSSLFAPSDPVCRASQTCQTQPHSGGATRGVIPEQTDDHAGKVADRGSQPNKPLGRRRRAWNVLLAVAPWSPR